MIDLCMSPFFSIVVMAVLCIYSFVMGWHVGAGHELEKAAAQQNKNNDHMRKLMDELREGQKANDQYDK